VRRVYQGGRQAESLQIQLNKLSCLGSKCCVRESELRITRRDIHSLIDQQERVQVVGYSGHICEECLQIYLLSFTNEFKPQVINHKCILENLVKALILSEKQKSDKLREKHIQIPLHIRDHIIHNSKDGLIFLNAIRDPSDMRSNKIKSIPPNQYDWSSRAIQGGCTPIDHKELTEFLIQANPFSFGVFNLSDGETPAYYLMAVSDTPIFITAKSFSWFNCSLITVRVDANLLLFRWSS
jgi:hypothetical protein